MLLNAFFGVSTMSLKNSLSFSMFATSAIIFIKCRNCHQMKNNIRCKGNINNTSVIIFLKSKIKNSQRWYFAWENLRGGFYDVSCCSSFHFWSWFHFVVILHLSMFFIHICFSTSSLTLLCGLSPGVYTHFIFSAQPIAEWFVTLSFSTIPLSYCCAALRLWVGIFLSTCVFCLVLLRRHFSLHLSRPPWGPAALPWGFQGFWMILGTQTRPVCLFSLHQSSVIFRTIQF